MHPRERVGFRTAALKSAHQWRDPEASTVTPDGLDVRSNDYLGLAGRVSRETMSGGRAGAGASRLVSGTWPEHVKLERALADWLGTESALVFSSGYAANLGAVSALGGPGEAIFSDALNHASIIDGCRLSRADVVVLPHADSGALETALRADHRVKWVVTESYFSMDADSPDLRRVRALCDEHEAALIVDEAHALGVFGPGGRGLCAEQGVQADVLVGAFGKSFGVQGGFVAGRKLYCDWLWNRARSFVYSTGISPVQCMHLLERLAVVREAEGARQHLRDLEHRLLARLAGTGVRLTPGRHGPIFPIVIGDEVAALEAAEAATSLGVHCHAIRPPTVPRGTARLRVTLRADLSLEAIDRLARALIAAVRVGARTPRADEPEPRLPGVASRPSVPGMGAEEGTARSALPEVAAVAPALLEPAPRGGEWSSKVPRSGQCDEPGGAVGAAVPARGAGGTAPASGAPSSGHTGGAPTNASNGASEAGPDGRLTPGATVARSGVLTNLEGAASGGVGSRRGGPGAASGHHSPWSGGRTVTAGCDGGRDDGLGRRSVRAPVGEDEIALAAGTSSRQGGEGAARGMAAPRDAVAGAGAVDCEGDGGAARGPAVEGPSSTGGVPSEGVSGRPRCGPAAADPAASYPSAVHAPDAGTAEGPSRTSRARKRGPGAWHGEAGAWTTAAAPGTDRRTTNEPVGVEAVQAGETDAERVSTHGLTGDARGGQLGAQPLSARVDPTGAGASFDAGGLSAGRGAPPGDGDLLGGAASPRRGSKRSFQAQRGSDARAGAPSRWVVLGTGTGVGKTYVAAALVRALAAGGRSVAGIKPIETGVGSEGALDARALEQASFHVKHPHPHPLYSFTEPLTPARAARLSNETIELGAIRDWLEKAAAPSGGTPDLVVETAGGVFSPLGEAFTNFELAQGLGPSQWLLVAPDRLGVLHEVGSCLRALASLGRPPDYILLSTSGDPDASTGTNAEELSRITRIPVLTIPRHDPRPLAALLRAHTR